MNHLKDYPMATATADRAEAALYFLLAANHVIHDPATPEAIMAFLCYVALASIKLAKDQEE